MQEELGADVCEVGALGQQRGRGAVHELVNPGESPWGYPSLFPETDLPLPPSHPQNLNAPLEVSRQKPSTTQSMASLWGMCRIMLAGRHAETTTAQTGDLGPGEVEGLTQPTRPRLCFVIGFVVFCLVGFFANPLPPYLFVS